MRSLNVLILVDNIKFHYQSVYNSLSSTLGRLNYCYHHISDKTFISVSWQKNCRLFVAAHISLPETHKDKLINFAQNGGKVLCLSNSIFDFFSLHPHQGISSLSFLGSSEVREVENIHFVAKYQPELNTCNYKVNIFGAINSPMNFGAEIVLAGIKTQHGNVVISTLDTFPPLYFSSFNKVFADLGISCRGETELSPPREISLQVFNKNKIPNLDNLIFDFKDPFDIYSSFEVPDEIKVFRDPDFVLMHTPTCPSTQDVAQKVCDVFPAKTNISVWSNSQTRGRGRGNNTWISLPGSVMMTCSYKTRRKSVIGQRPVFVQYIMAYAAVEAVGRLRPGIRLGIKWPNDVYLDGGKVGGVLVSSSFLGDEITFFCGIGLNVVRDDGVLGEWGGANFVVVPKSTGCVVGTILDVFYSTMGRIEEEGLAFFLELYLGLWLHGGDVLLLEEKGCYVRVVGLADDGFLEVEEVDTGQRHLVFPDGNSLDMMQNLIIRK